MHILGLDRSHKGCDPADTIRCWNCATYYCLDCWVCCPDCGAAETEEAEQHQQAKEKRR